MPDEDGLLVELQNAENHCQAHSLSLTVVVVNSITAFENLPSFTGSIPVRYDYRLALCPADRNGPDTGVCYRTLRFSSASRPKKALGTQGDIWITAEPGREAIYYRKQNLWLPWVCAETYAHPFMADYCLMFVGTTVEWRKGHELQAQQHAWDAMRPCEHSVFDSECVPCSQSPKPYGSLTIRHIVRHLYDPLGTPLHPDANLDSHTFESDIADVSRPSTPQESDAPPIHRSPSPSITDRIVPKSVPTAVADTHTDVDTDTDTDTERDSETDTETDNEMDAIPSTSSSTKYSRHPKLWYPEGTIVVRVEETYYRLFPTDLARHSRFFAAEFANDGGSGSVDGCSVVEVSDLASKDFEVWIEALENGSTNAQRTYSYAQATSLLRASSALASDSFVELAKGALTHLWDFDASSGPPTVPIREVFEVIVLARTHTLPSHLIKQAFWCLLHHEDPVGVALEIRASGSPSGSLSDADLALLAATHGRLRAQWAVDAMSSNRLFEHTPCTSKCICSGGLKLVVPRIGLLVLYQAYRHANVLRNKLCARCHRRLCRHWEKKHKAVWDELDIWLGLKADGDGSGKAGSSNRA